MPRQKLEISPLPAFLKLCFRYYVLNEPARKCKRTEIHKVRDFFHPLLLMNDEIIVAEDENAAVASNVTKGGTGLEKIL